MILTLFFFYVEEALLNITYVLCFDKKKMADIFKKKIFNLKFKKKKI